jgi:hypothetical protein
METTPTRPVLVKQIPSEENEVDLCIPRDLEDLTEGVDGVLPPHGVFLGVAYVIVRGEEDAEAAAEVRSVGSVTWTKRIGFLHRSQKSVSKGAEKHVYHKKGTGRGETRERRRWIGGLKGA